MFEKQRATVFGSKAAEYDRYRPSYPAEVIDMVVEHQPSTAVDIGCGTGIAARLVAERGVAVLGVEPDDRMAEVARQQGTNVVVATIEDWQPTPCDVMYSAQAWHWVDPLAGAQVAAASVRPDGHWLAIWNYETDSLFSDCRERVYQRLAPELAGVTVAGIDAILRSTVIEAFEKTTEFDDVEIRQVDWVDELTIEEAVGRLATHSKHQLTEQEHTLGMNEALTAELVPHGPTVRLPYTTRVFSARRR